MLLIGSTGVGATEAQDTGQQELVVSAEGASTDATHSAVAAPVGTIVSESTDVGVATVVTTNPDFAADAAGQMAIEGTAGNRVIGSVPERVDADGVAEAFDPAAAGVRVDARPPSGTAVTTTHVCEGAKRNNGFYGDGVVSALRVARGD